MISKNSFSLSLMVVAFLALSSCGGSDFRKSPVDEIVRDLPNDEIFSVILYDMDQKGNFSSTYYHKYQIIRELDGDASEVLTDWREVSEREFTKNIDNMGMEIVARDSTGALTKEAAPPGYNNYVGNPKYGQWENRGGTSFWAFYGQYAFMSSMFRMTMFPVHRSYYNDWRGNYRGTGRGYYGPGGTGSRYYGTGSGYSRTNNPNSSWTSSRNNSFKNRVASRTSRSSGRSSSRRSRGGGSGK
ncbi:MAG: hypothetical protein ABJG78_16360 [Cyclobacteriaceae bacterium]